MIGLQFDKALEELQILKEQMKNAASTKQDPVLCDLWTRHQSRLEEHQEVLEALLRVTNRSSKEVTVPVDETAKEEYLTDDLHFGIMLHDLVHRRFLQNK